MTQLVPLSTGIFVLADTATYEARRSIWGFRTNEVGTIALADPMRRRALTLGFDKPGTIRQGTKDDTLGDVVVGASSTKTTAVSFAETNGGKDFGANDKQSTYAKR